MVVEHIVFMVNTIGVPSVAVVQDNNQKERWDIFQELDSLFEFIVTDGNNRLKRSISSY